MDSDVSRTIIELLQAGKKIEAIKLFRDSTGCDLKTAKDEVERIEASLDGEAVDPPPFPDPAASGADLSLESDVRALLSEGKKIEAIKRVRERSGMGLKESKEWVEKLEGPGPRSAGCLNILLALVALLGLLRLFFS